MCQTNFIWRLRTDANLEILSFDASLFSSGPYPEPYLFINQWVSGIHAIDLLTHDRTVVIRGLKKNYAMAIDRVEMKMYFRNGTSISRANLDGTGAESFLPNTDVFKIAIDWIGRRIFWRTYNTFGKGEILVMQLDGKGKRALIKQTDSIYDIAVDPKVG